MKWNYISLYEFIEPKVIMFITLFLILFDHWGQSLRDGFSRWTLVRVLSSAVLYGGVFYLAMNKIF